MSKSHNIVISNCEMHKEEAAHAFCHRHCQTICMKCLLDAHRDCVHGNEVEDIGKTFQRSQTEFLETPDSHKRLTERHKAWKEHFDKCKEELDVSEDRLTAGLKQMRLRLIEQVNRLASEAIEMVHSVTGEQRSMILTNLDRLGRYSEKLKDTDRRIEETKNQNDISICEAMWIVNTLAQLDNDFKEMEITSKDTKLSFFVSKEVRYIKEKFKSFGELCIEDAKKQKFNDKHPKLIANFVPSQSGLFYTGDIEEVFVLPIQPDEEATGNSLYHYIGTYVRSTNKPCMPPPPPPLPEMHPPKLPNARSTNKPCMPPPPPLPEMHPPKLPKSVRDSWKCDADNVHAKPRGALEKVRAEVKKSSSFNYRFGKDARLSIPELPRRRSGSLSAVKSSSSQETIVNLSIEEETKSAKKSEIEEKHAQIAHELDNLSDKSETSVKATETKTPDLKTEDINTSRKQKMSEKPPTLPKPHNCQLEANTPQDPKLLNEAISCPPPKPHTFIAELTQKLKTVTFDKFGTITIPSIPAKRKARRSIFKTVVHVDSSSESSEFTEVHSDNEFLPNLTASDSSAAKALSLTDLSKPEDEKDQKEVSFYSGSESSMEYRSAASLNSNVSSNSCSSCRSLVTGRKISLAEQMDKLFPSDDEGKHPHTVTLRIQNFDKRKSRSLTMSTVLKEAVKSPSSQPPVHSLFTGLSVTQSGKLFLCDFENHYVQLFDPEGLPLCDYQLSEPFHCCLIREELVAVTSKYRKSLSLFDVSESNIIFKHEQVVSVDTDVFGVGFTHGFLGVACGDKVVILTETLQHYRTVKPVTMVKKKRPKPFFNDVKYVALEWSAEGFHLYASEHKMDRVACIDLGNKDQPIWTSHVRKPKSLLLSGDRMLIAAKGKIVVLETSKGHCVKEIHHDVPSHPINVVRNGDWLYITKNSTSNAESRNIRRISMI